MADIILRMEWKVALIKNKFLIGGIVGIILINIIALIQWKNRDKFGSDEFWAEPTATPWLTDTPTPTSILIPTP